MCPGRIKNRKLYIWPIFTCINRIFDTGYPIHVNWLPLRVVRSRNSVYISLYVSPYPMNVPEWLDKKVNRGRQRVALHGTNQSYLVRLQELHARPILFMHFVLLNHHVHMLEMIFIRDDNWDIFVTWQQRNFAKSVYGFRRLGMRLC